MIISTGYICLEFKIYSLSSSCICSFCLLGSFFVVENIDYGADWKVYLRDLQCNNNEAYGGYIEVPLWTGVVLLLAFRVCKVRGW